MGILVLEAKWEEGNTAHLGVVKIFEDKFDVGDGQGSRSAADADSAPGGGGVGEAQFHL